MTGKNVLYAAVGAPVVAARKVAEVVTELRSTMNKEADSLGKTANKRVSVWASEGEKVVNRITDAKVVDDLTSKVDFDQVSTQVSKLRDQLEDMLTTWRASFRPEKVTNSAAEAVKATATKPSAEAKKAVAATTGTKKAAGRRSAAKKAPAKVHAKKAASKSSGPVKATKSAKATKTGAGKTGAGKTGAGKTGAAKSTAAKSTAAKSTAAKSTAAKSTAAKSSAKKVSAKAAS